MDELFLRSVLATQDGGTI